MPHCHKLPLKFNFLSLFCTSFSSKETFDAGLKLLPYGSVVHLMRLSLRATAAAAVKAFGPDGVKAYNLYAAQRLAADLATMERFAGRWGIPALAEELAEPCQLCQLLLSCKVSFPLT